MSEIHSSFATVPTPNEVLVPSASILLDRARTPGHLYIESYLNAINGQQGNAASKARTIRMIARSANIGLAGSVWQRLETIREHNVEVFAVFTDFRIQREDELRRYAAIFGFDKAMANIRIAQFPNAHKIVEQMQLGVHSVWADAGRFEMTASLVPEAAYGSADSRDVAAARVSFEMIWAISDEISRRDINSRR